MMDTKKSGRGSIGYKVDFTFESSHCRYFTVIVEDKSSVLDATFFFGNFNYWKQHPGTTPISQLFETQRLSYFIYVYLYNEKTLTKFRDKLI